MAAPMSLKICARWILKSGNISRFQASRAPVLEFRYFSSISSCKSLVYDKYGDPVKVLKLVKNSVPEVHDDSVLIKMIASPINPADINSIQGIYPIKPDFPAVAGFEGVGEIQEVGSNVKQLLPGERVIFPASVTGTWCSHLVCPASQVMVVPKDTPPLVAATVKVNACTAYRMLADFENLREGDTVIQNAANSGAGQAVIQIAAARGLKTINIVRDRPNLTELTDYLHDLGATVVTTEGDLRKSASTLLKDLPKPKLALNAVGGKSIIALVKQIQDAGTIVTYGGMSKQPVMVPTGSLIFNDLKFKGFWMSRWHQHHAGSEEARQMFEQLCRWGGSGQLRAPQHRLVDIEDYRSALEKALGEYSTEKQILTFGS
ncbi:enoyl-[acyl-carrier-protein] reductase, mitochondrial-like [Lytechinus variegatus]|uniref:enoyl-[acyl-carrier-protein] reductase, mitochondrial-like n=1 Tax=Lytechinus variegatus TaxID=7654 RepID=UPI001BB0D804|nr:enoyl-[acyl-carrier-protein] reductase, mitochondrial-like [Lytechinus variegatus]